VEGRHPAGVDLRLVVAIAIAALPSHSDLAGSWTPDPDPVSAVDMAAAGTACSAELARASAHWPIKPAAMTPVLAERRGRLTAVMMMAIASTACA
jgi:hypothetical protein